MGINVSVELAQMFNSPKLFLLEFKSRNLTISLVVAQSHMRQGPLVVGPVHAQLT